MSNRLTERDMEIVQKVFQCFQSADAMKIDTDKLAELAGFSNGKSANASWLVIKKKLMAGATVSDASANKGEDGTPTKPKAAPKKRTPKAKAETEADAAADDEATPTPKAKAPAKRKITAVEPSAPETNGDDAQNGNPASDNLADGNDEPATKPKRKYNRKPRDGTAPPTKRAKKGTKATAESRNPVSVKEELASEADGHDEEGQQASIFGDGDAIKDEANEDEGGDFMGEEEADGADQLIGEGEFENQIGGGASV